MVRMGLCLCAVLAGPAGAETCPATFADAVRGVTVDYADGSRASSRLDMASGMVTEDWVPADGPGVRTVLDHGVHITRIEEIVKTDPPTAGAIYSYQSPPPPVAEGGQKWEVSYRMSDLFSGQTEGRYQGTVGPAAEVKIGNCSFQAYSVSAVMREPDFVNYLQMDFLPALGISILRGYGPSLTEMTVTTPVGIRMTQP
jgi:hypothetical protein